MRFSSTAGLVALATSASAFSDTSPFVLLSTSQFDQPTNDAELQTNYQVVTSAYKILDSCPTARYHIISQPNARAADIRGSEGCKIQSLCDAVSSDRVNSVFSVAEVVGAIEPHGLTKHIQSACEAQGKSSSIAETRLPTLASDGRANQLAENDQALASVLEDIQSADSYTVLFLASAGAGEPYTYEAEFPSDAFSDELKRLRARSSPEVRADNGTERDTRSLFEKYQFFTPGIFHGIVVALLLFSILGVGVNALSSLKVPYAAFEKEMGPAAHKKNN